MLGTTTCPFLYLGWKCMSQMRVCATEYYLRQPPSHSSISHMLFCRVPCLQTSPVCCARLGRLLPLTHTQQKQQ